MQGSDDQSQVLISFLMLILLQIYINYQTVWVISSACCFKTALYLKSVISNLEYLWLKHNFPALIIIFIVIIVYDLWRSLKSGSKILSRAK